MKTSKTNRSRPKRQTAREFLELQRLMAGAVMHPLSSAGKMQAKWRDGQPMKKVVANFIKPNDRLTSFERLEIYNRQYWFRLKDCFYDDYPGLRAILGDDGFERLCRAYLEKHPSHSFSLRNLGQSLIAFLKAEPRWGGPRPPLAVDMARLEWAHIEAFDNEAKAPLEPDSLLGLDPSAIYLQLQPHITLLQLGYEVDEFLIRAKQGEKLRNEASNAMEQSQARRRTRLRRPLKPQTTFLAVHRHNNTVFYKRLEPGQFRLLSAFQAHASMADAVQQLMDAEGAQGQLPDVRGWFEVWATLGWFCKLE